MQNSTDVRIRRAEQDIETLRTTQNRILDRIDSFAGTLEATREIAAENRSRLERVESRLERVESRLERVDSRVERVESRLKLVEEVVLENRAIVLENRDMIRENRDMIRENRDILLNIADHLDLTLETPPQDSQSD